jgi:hypothetical protein
MTTLMATATAAITAALQAAPAVAPQVARVRLRPLGTATTTAVVVRPAQAEAAEQLLSGMPIQWACQIAVECYAKTTTTTAPDAAVDSLLAATYARLMADPTLAGAVGHMQPVGIAYDFDVDGEQTACAILTLQVRQTAANPAIF